MKCAKNQSDSQPSPAASAPDARQLGEILELIRNGQRDLAMIELGQWSRQSDCPSRARLLYAGLLADSGQPDRALRIVSQLVESDNASAAELKMMICLLVEQELDQTAEKTLGRLFDQCGDQSGIDTWIHATRMPGHERLPAESRATVEMMAGELLVEPGLIPSLVYGLRLAPDRSRAAMLRRAIAHLLPAFEDTDQMLPACQALAELSMLLGEESDARRWAHRGLKIDPYCAKLAMLLARLSDDPQIGPAAAKVLRRVLSRYEQYPDVRAALIRREHRDGRFNSARKLLADWLKRDPKAPLARGLEQELTQ